MKMIEITLEQAKRKIIKVGVIGYSAQKFPEGKAKQFLLDTFKSIMKKYEHSQLEIVSGYSNIGVPRLAYEIADKLGLITVGFAPKEVLNYELYPIKKKIIKGEKFGDESIYFLKYIDILVRVGGGNQAKREWEIFKKYKKPMYFLDI